MTRVYFDWNVWSFLTSTEIDINNLSQRCRNKAIEIFISPVIIEEMCQSPHNIIDASIKVIEELKTSPILKYPNEIETKELLIEMRHSCPNLVSKSIPLICPIFGDGNSQTDRDWQKLLSNEYSVDSNIMHRIKKNKLINKYYQIRLKHNNFLLDTICDEISVEKATSKINKISQLWIQPEKLTIKHLENEIKKVKKRPHNSIIKEWVEYEEIEKEKVIAEFCKSQIISEYILPFYNKQVYRSTKVDYFLESLNINDANDGLNLMTCLCDRIDFERIPSLWISIAIAVLQLKKEVKKSNVFDQMHAVYLKELDIFLTCDKQFFKILSGNLMKNYLKSIGSRCRIIYLHPNDITNEMIISKISVV